MITDKSLSLTFLLLAGMLLGYTSCTSPNPGTSSPGQHIATTSNPGPSGTAKARPTLTVEEALLDALINKVKDSDLQHCLRELGKDPSKINDSIIRADGQTLAHTPLELAVLCGEVEAVEGLLQAGADINQKDGVGDKPLHQAVYGGNLAVVRALIAAAGANIDQQDGGGDTPLHQAVRRGGPEIVQALIAAGADISRPNKRKDTPLHWAVRRGNLAVVQALIDALIAAGADINQPNNRGNTPLHQAASKGNLAVVQALIDALIAVGADINKKNNLDETPLRIANLFGSLQIVEILEEHGATY